MLSNSLPDRFNQQVLIVFLIQEAPLHNRVVFHDIVQEEAIGAQEHVHHLIAVIFYAPGKILPDGDRERHRLIDVLYQSSLGGQSQNGQQRIGFGCFIAVLLDIAEPDITAVVAQTVEKSISEEVAAFAEGCVVHLELQVNGRIGGMNEFVGERPRKLIVDGHIHIAV